MCQPAELQGGPLGAEVRAQAARGGDHELDTRGEGLALRAPLVLARDDGRAEGRAAC